MAIMPGSAAPCPPGPDRGRRPRRALVALAAGVPGLALGLLLPATTASAASGTTHVATDGTDSAHCGGSGDPCRSVMQGVTNAHPGGTVSVAAGTYHEQVVVSAAVEVDGKDAVIDASGLSSGSGETLNAAAVLLTPSAGGATFAGFTVRGAYGEGILVQGAAHVRIRDNTVVDNDLGTPANTAYAECQAQGPEPGDCGEGLHLMSATDALVEHNTVSRNSGGILVTDEMGPATRNRIVGNVAKDNLSDCGITLPSHNPEALSATGVRQPDKGGVFGNVVDGNTVVGNGVHGAGAGVLVAAAGPGMASYENRIVDNHISGNGMPGVTIHSHTPNQDVSGNVITDNDIGRNNLNGDADAGDLQTTGILVFSAVVPTSETVSANDIDDNEMPIWTSDNVTRN
jgi:nitrous oxidase accessory protein NosD